jgi:hypothetical protein
MRAKADGWFGYLSTPKYIEQLALPNVTAGAKLAGCDPAPWIWPGRSSFTRR